MLNPTRGDVTENASGLSLPPPNDLGGGNGRWRGAEGSTPLFSAAAAAAAASFLPVNHHKSQFQHTSKKELC